MIMNNYEASNPLISFRTTKIKKDVASRDGKPRNMSANEIVREVFDKWVSGDLVEKQTDIKLEYEKAKLEKIKLENKLLQMKVDFGENFQKPISLSGTRLISANVKQIQEDIQSPYDELNKRLKCPDCTRPFEWLNQSGFIDQIKEFSNHLKISHNRELNALEKDVIDNLQYEEIK